LPTVAELRDEQADLFQKAGPKQQKGQAPDLEGFKPDEVLFKLQPGEAMRIARKADPNAGKVRERPHKQKQGNWGGTLTEKDPFTLSPGELLKRGRAHDIERVWGWQCVSQLAGCPRLFGQIQIGENGGCPA